eukprot:6798303-Lingulodinium_polyedra.AAC.1
MRHLAMHHAGDVLGAKGASVLNGLDLGLCGGCGVVRTFRSRHCACHEPAPPPRFAVAEDK